MKHMKHGFTLIEFIVSTLIASMIGSILLTALYQSGRFQRTVNNMFDDSLRVGIVTNQLEKDLMGAFVPVQARIKEDKDEDEQSAEGSADKSVEKEDKKKDVKKSDTEETKKGTSKPAEKPLEKIFVSSNKGQNLETLTFITNNPIAVFVGKDVGVVKPKLVRVRYVLKPEGEDASKTSGEKKDTFTLFRQETTELDLAKLGNTRSYELITGIKEFSVTYTAKIEKNQPDSSSTKATADGSSAKALSDKSADKGAKKVPEQEPKKEYEYKTSKDWVSERKQEEQKKEQPEEQEYPRIPYLIEIKMVLWNDQHTQTKEFILSFELPVDTSPDKKKDEKKEEKKDDKKSQKKDIEKKPSDSNVDKNQQVLNEKNDLIETLTVTLGNLTKVFSKST